MREVFGRLLDKKILVTGGAGFIGSHLVDKLIEIGASHIVVLDNLSSGSLKNIKEHVEKNNIIFVNADLKAFKDIVEHFREIDIVFHFAANPEVRVSVTEPRIHFRENIEATFNVLEACRLNDVKYLIFASSSTVYGEPKVRPTPEDYHPLHPISVYGAAKLACEDLMRAYSSLYDIRTLVLRYANIVGPRTTHGVIYDFIKKLLLNPRQLEILGDGTQTKSYLYVTDAVEATLLATAHLIEKDKKYEVYNVGNKDWVNVRKIADIVVEEMGLKDVKYVFKLVTPDGRGWPGDVKLMLLDISKIERDTNWRPKYTSEQAVRLTARHLVKELVS